MIYFKSEQYDLFRCVGSACPYTCCGGDWKIYVDNKTLARYRTIGGAFGERLNASIDCSGDIPRLKQHESNQNCVMMTEEGWCSIQLELGEDALCDVCRRYPRSVRRTGNTVFMTVTPSCPEVSKELLLRRDTIKLLSGHEEDGDDTEKDILLREAFRTALALLKDRNCTITQRQKLFLVFSNAMQEALTKNDRDEAKELLRFFGKPDEYRAVAGSEKLDCELTSKIHVVNRISEPLLKETSAEACLLFADLIKYLLWLTNNEGLAKLVPYLEKLDGARHAREQENLLINSCFLTYCGEELDGDLYRQAGYSVLFNQAFRFLCALGSVREGELLSVDARALYWSFLSRGIEHNQKFARQFTTHLWEEKLMELPFLFRLIS